MSTSDSLLVQPWQKFHVHDHSKIASNTHQNTISLCKCCKINTHGAKNLVAHMLQLRDRVIYPLTGSARSLTTIFEKRPTQLVILLPNSLCNA